MTLNTFSKLNGAEGLLESPFYSELKDKIEEGEAVIVRNVRLNKFSYYTILSLQDVISTRKANECLYEVIDVDRIKHTQVYVDVDVKNVLLKDRDPLYQNTLENSITALMESMKAHFPTYEPDLTKWFINDSTYFTDGVGKISFHIHTEVRATQSVVKSIAYAANEKFVHIDTSPYGPKQNFRLLRQSKPGRNAPLFPLTEFTYKGETYVRDYNPVTKILASQIKSTMQKSPNLDEDEVHNFLRSLIGNTSALKYYKPSEDIVLRSKRRYEKRTSYDICEEDHSLVVDILSGRYEHIDWGEYRFSDAGFMEGALLYGDKNRTKCPAHDRAHQSRGFYAYFKKFDDYVYLIVCCRRDNSLIEKIPFKDLKEPCDDEEDSDSEQALEPEPETKKPKAGRKPAINPELFDTETPEQETEPIPTINTSHVDWLIDETVGVDLGKLKAEFLSDRVVEFECTGKFKGPFHDDLEVRIDWFIKNTIPNTIAFDKRTPHYYEDGEGWKRIDKNSFYQVFEHVILRVAKPAFKRAISRYATEFGNKETNGSVVASPGDYRKLLRRYYNHPPALETFSTAVFRELLRQYRKFPKIGDISDRANYIPFKDWTMIDIVYNKKLPLDPYLGFPAFVSFDLIPIDQGNPVIDKYLLESAPAKKDETDFLLASAGQSLTGDIEDATINCLYGKTKCGKSVFLYILKKIAGDYYTKMTPRCIEWTHNKTAHDSNISTLKNHRVCILEDFQETKIDNQKATNWTDNEWGIRKAGEKDQDCFTNESHLWFSINENTEVQFVGEQIVRRFCFFEFRQPPLPDKYFKKKLSKADFDYFGSLCIYKLLTRKTPEPPKTLLDFRKQVANDNHSITAFFSECMESKPGTSTILTDMYSAYQTWSRFNQGNKRYRTKKAFVADCISIFDLVSNGGLIKTTDKEYRICGYDFLDGRRIP